MTRPAFGLNRLASRAVRGPLSVIFPVLCLALLFGCASPPAPSSGAGPERSGAQQTTGPKRIVAVTPGTPLAFNERVSRAVVSGPYRGGPELEWLVNSSLTIVDDRGTRLGQLAEKPPTTENGLWKGFPDGPME